MPIISIRSRLQICLLVFLSSWAAGSYADCGGVPGQGICENVKITLLYVDPSNAYVRVTGNMAALPCNPAGNLIKLPNGTANFNAIYASLLAAHLADRLVNVRVANTPDCLVAYVTIPQ
jgi:hypothetical protein